MDGEDAEFCVMTLWTVRELIKGNFGYRDRELSLKLLNEVLEKCLGDTRRI